MWEMCIRERVIGVDSDQYDDGIYEGNKSVVLTSAIKKIDEAAYQIIEDDINGEFPLSKMFYDKYIDVKRDRQFLHEFIKTNLSRRIVDSFMHFLTESCLLYTSRCV